MHFQQYFSYIVSASIPTCVSGGHNQYLPIPHKLLVTSVLETEVEGIFWATMNVKPQGGDPIYDLQVDSLMLYQLSCSSGSVIIVCLCPCAYMHIYGHHCCVWTRMCMHICMSDCACACICAYMLLKSNSFGLAIQVLCGFSWSTHDHNILIRLIWLSPVHASFHLEVI